MTLPVWLRGLPDPERMRAADAWAIEERGIPAIELMERARRGLADLVAEVVPSGAIAVATSLFRTDFSFASCSSTCVARTS